MIAYYILSIENESDREFMESLYYEYHRLMYSTILHSIEDQELVEDVMQTTFERLIDRIPLLKTLSRDRLVNYILSSCKNNAYNLKRYMQRHNPTSFDFDSENTNYENSIELHLIIEEDLACLERIWPLLDKRSRYLLRAKYILGMKTEDIAMELNIKSGSVRMALSRARKEAYKLMTNGKKFTDDKQDANVGLFK